MRHKTKKKGMDVCGNLLNALPDLISHFRYSTTRTFHSRKSRQPVSMIPRRSKPVSKLLQLVRPSVG
jgi:hypothetical protein